ncbi:universal stress protein [Hymenobacter sp. 15J16-1T3B]|uniref:universal stress protein n=1 Tax=Hymenobacter sp. 15J16-1T3B TaxID=2886941 RepID=UPI001D11FE6A|nr:universal stress protein [Hymenobacter sp. 15J16-1T3B]MCC3156689.1 universal stress protein [Hymenobacter sp. 15J16-1T3B]
MTTLQPQATPSAVPAADTPTLSLIVLTNFLPAARRAIRYAAELAAPLGAQLVLLHVREVSVLEGELLYPDTEERAGELLVAVQALADETYVPTTVELVADLQLSTAAALAQRYAPAVFVLGQAAEPAEEGEVAAAVREVLRSGEFPLLIVPEAYRGAVPPRQVLVAADGEPFALSRPEAARQLLAQVEPALTVVKVSAIEDDQACAAALHQVQASGLAAAAGRLTVEAMHHVSPVAGLLRAIEQTEANLLVVIARRRSFLGAMFHRSVTSRLLHASPVPLLLLPASDE